MKIVVFAALLAVGQTTQAPVDKIGAAYEQFLLAHYLESNDDVNGAIAAYKKAQSLDPASAEIPAELAALYMRQSRAQDALEAAEQALKIDPANREAHRVAGFVYAALGEGQRGGRQRQPQSSQPDDNVTRAIEHLEKAIDGAVAESDPNVRATLARLYVRNGLFAKAIPLLSDLVNQEPGWQEGPVMLAEAMTRQASALLQTGNRADLVKARDLLDDLVSDGAADAQTLYLLSQAQRRLGEAAKAEATARRVIEQNARSPWGYYALAEALVERHQYQAVVDALTPPVADLRARGSANELGLLLPHLGFAYQELGQFDKALALFEEARKLAPNDPAVTSYLVQANIAAKKYADAAEIAHQARAGRPDDLRLARLEAQALRQGGKTDQGIGLLQEVVQARANDPNAYVALAELYSEAERGAQAVAVLQDAQKKFPDEVSVAFELGAVLDKQKRYADAEAAFKQVLARDPDHAPALNYLGYMLAERGDRLDESVDYIKKALAVDPENGSYLDSLGWAYFKQDKLDLAEESLKKAAAQLTANSVIQDHYGDLLARRGRYDEAIAAWTRALAGDGDSIDRGVIDRKIQSAKQKIGKK